MDASPEFAQPVLACLVALLAVTKDAQLAEVARRDAITRVPLLAATPGARLPLLLSSAAIGGLAPPSMPGLTLAALALCVLLAIDARFERSAAPGTRWMPVRARDHARARLQALELGLGPGSWLDATTPCGLTLLATITVLAWLAGGAVGETAGHLAWLAAPLFLTGTRLHRPAPLHVTLQRLDRAHRSLTPTQRDGGEIVVLVDARDRAIDARWRTHWTHSLPGLERVDLVFVEVRWLDRVRTVPAWLASAIERSPADDALAAALPHAQRFQDGDRVARLALVHALDAELDALRGWLAPRLDDALPRAA